MTVRWQTPDHSSTCSTGRSRSTRSEAGRCPGSGARTRSRKCCSEGHCGHAACDTGSMTAAYRARRTSRTSAQGSPCSWTAASGTGAPSTSGCRRRELSSGRRRSGGTVSDAAWSSPHTPQHGNWLRCTSARFPTRSSQMTFSSIGVVPTPMAKGFLFTLGSESALNPDRVLDCGAFGVVQGTQGTKTISWSSNQLDTFADYRTIQPGDFIFFFRNRRIYGAGRVVPKDGIVWAFAGAADATIPLPSGKSRHKMTAKGIKSENPQHFLEHATVWVRFERVAGISAQGIDMDEVLALPAARPDWPLRFFLGRSFLQLESTETSSLLAVLRSRFHRGEPGPNDTGHPATPPPGAKKLEIRDLVAARPEYVNSGGRVNQERLLHGLLIEALWENPSWQLDDARHGVSSTTSELYHEFFASSAKPQVYANKIDVLRRVGPEEGVITGLDLFEMKQGSVTAADSRSVTQLMKYVDYIALNHAGGDYSLVRGWFIGHDFSPEVIDSVADQSSAGGWFHRTFMRDPTAREPPQPWMECHLLRYRWNVERRSIDLYPI